MRLCIRFVDRIGIFQEMLLVFVERRLNVAVVEVDSPNIYIDVPDLIRDRLPAVREALALVSGVQDIIDVDMLPGMRHRLYLDALLAGGRRDHLARAKPYRRTAARGATR